VRRALAAFAILVTLGACEDQPTALARCRVEGFKALGAASTESNLASCVQSCMRVAGYKTTGVCTWAPSIAYQLSCYLPDSLLARAANLNGG
jgi:hypothetical protein